MPDTTNRRLHPDRELVARMASKDGNALQELMARHERTAYAVAIGILHNSAQAEQAVAQAFRQAFSLADRFVPGEITVLAWLTSLTRRQAEAMAAVASSGADRSRQPSKGRRTLRPFVFCGFHVLPARHTHGGSSHGH